MASESGMEDHEDPCSRGAVGTEDHEVAGQPSGAVGSLDIIVPMGSPVIGAEGRRLASELAREAYQRTTDGPAVLYRMFDASSDLLYVGISASAAARFGQHAGEKSWWSEVRTITVEHFAARHEALTAETHAIAVEQPIHNIAGVPGPPRGAEPERIQPGEIGTIRPKVKAS